MANYKAKYISGDPNAASKDFVITFELYRNDILLEKFIDAYQGSGFIPAYVYKPDTKEIYIESNSYFYNGFGEWGNTGTLLLPVKYNLPVNDIEKNVKINIEGYTFPPVSTPPAPAAAKPTGEIKKFIDSVNSDINILVSSLESKKAEIKKVYDEAIKITSLKTTKWPFVPPQYTESDPNVKTIGDLFKYTFNIETGDFKKPISMIGGISPNPDYMDWVSDLNGKSTGDTTINDKYEFLNKSFRSISQLVTYKYWIAPPDDFKSRIENPDLYSPGQIWFDTFMNRFLTVIKPDENGGEQSRVKDSIYESNLLSDEVKRQDVATVSISSFTSDGNRINIGTYSDGNGIVRKLYEPRPGYHEFDNLLEDVLNMTTYVPFSISYYAGGLTNSFPSLRTKYKSGLISDLRNDPIFEVERGRKSGSSSSWSATDQFVGNDEDILLYKAFIEAGDKYKQVHLPYKNPPKKEEAAPPPPPETISSTQSGASQSDDKKYIFNVETDGKFVNKELGSFTVIPPLNNIETPFIYREEENILDDEYTESGYEEDIALSSEQSMLKDVIIPDDPDHEGTNKDEVIKDTKVDSSPNINGNTGVKANNPPTGANKPGKNGNPYEINPKKITTTATGKIKKMLEIAYGEIGYTEDYFELTTDPRDTITTKVNGKNQTVTNTRKGEEVWISGENSDGSPKYLYKKDAPGKDTKYGVYWGTNGHHFCGMFVNWCAEQGGMKMSVNMPNSIYCPNGVSEFNKKGFYISNGKNKAERKSSTIIPEPGDIVYFNWSGAADAGHVGIVVKQNADGTIKCVEGNTGAAAGSGVNGKGAGVWEKDRKKETIIGYGKTALFDPSNTGDFVASVNKKTYTKTA
jgi:hypothetical protein